MHIYDIYMDAHTHREPETTAEPNLFSPGWYSFRLAINGAKYVYTTQTAHIHAARIVCYVQYTLIYFIQWRMGPIHVQWEPRRAFSCYVLHGISDSMGLWSTRFFVVVVVVVRLWPRRLHICVHWLLEKYIVQGCSFSSHRQAILHLTLWYTENMQCNTTKSEQQYDNIIGIGEWSLGLTYRHYFRIIWAFDIYFITN